MKKSFLLLAVFATLAFAFSSCGKSDDTPEDKAATVSIYISASKGPDWEGYGMLDSLGWGYSINDFVNELVKIGYYDGTNATYLHYTVETTESQKANVTAELTQKLLDYYTDVMNKIQTYDFSARLTDEQKKNAYCFKYTVAAAFSGLDLSLNLTVCNPQLVKGMTYVTDDANAEVKSFTIDNGVLNHFNDVKTATLTLADGTTKTATVDCIKRGFYLKGDTKYLFYFTKNDGLDTSELTLDDFKTTYKLQ